MSGNENKEGLFKRIEHKLERKDVHEKRSEEHDERSNTDYNKGDDSSGQYHQGQASGNAKIAENEDKGATKLENKLLGRR